MKTKEMDKLMAHFDKYFKQSDCQVLHPLSMTPHIDTLVYKPTSELPYWKLVSMGASDFRMPAKKPFLGDRNEYMMFVDAQEDLTDKETLDRYVMYLMEVAHYPIVNQCYITYGHSVEWKPEENEEMVCAFLEMPQIISDPNVLRCKHLLTQYKRMFDFDPPMLHSENHEITCFFCPAKLWRNSAPHD